MSHAVRRKLRGKRIPAGFDAIEDSLDSFESQMRDAVQASHEGLKKNESAWKVHRLHFEKNRFIFDVYYKRQLISKELFDFLVREKVADGPLISKWRKPGYETLCSLLAIQKSGHNFGTTSLCRVPLAQRSKEQKYAPDNQTGCVACASGDGLFGGPIWWNTDRSAGAKAEDNRTTWEGPAGAGATAGEGDDSGGKGKGKRPRPPANDDDDDELDDDVAKRLAMLQGRA